MSGSHIYMVTLPCGLTSSNAHRRSSPDAMYHFLHSVVQFEFYRDQKLRI